MHTNEREEVTEKSFNSMINDIYTKTVMILKPPFLCRTIVVCLIACFVTSAYYTLTLWLPELFHRYADFQQAYPNQTASVCTLKITKNSTNLVSIFKDVFLGALWVNMGYNSIALLFDPQEEMDDPFGCNSRVQTSVFVHTFILGASCIPTGLILPLLVNYVGYKFLLGN